MLRLNWDGFVAHVILDRPQQRNAFDAELIQAIDETLSQVAQAPQLRALVLRGEGQHFSAGADLGWMKSMAQASAEDNRRDAQALASMLRHLYDFPVPTVVMVQGAAMGGALGLIACADWCIASDDARFALSELRLGLAPAVISPYLLRAMGPRHLMHLALSASVFDADTARRIGLVHEIHPLGQLDTALDQALHQLHLTGPQASRACKALLRAQTPAPDVETEQQTVDLIAALRVSDEGQSGLQAFFAKQTPSWQIPS